VIENIKIFGLPRTCTNITEIIIKRNFVVKVLVNEICNKHAQNHYADLLPTEDLKKTGFILCCKHPYQWIISAFMCCKEKISIRKFITDPPVMAADPFWKEGSTIIEIYNKINKQWMDSFVGHKFFVVKQENYQNQHKLITNLASTFNIKNSKIKKIINKASTCGKMSKKLYKPRIETLDGVNKKIVNQQIDLETLSRLGYSLP